MVKKSGEYKVEQREHMRGGDGTAEVANFATPEEMNNKGRLFARITLKPGCSIGYHVHEADSEIFYLQAGVAEYNDNGDVRTISAGDVTVCPAGTGHSVANKGSEDVVLMALILNA